MNAGSAAPTAEFQQAVSRSEAARQCWPRNAHTVAQAGEIQPPKIGCGTHAPVAQPAHRNPGGRPAQIENPDACDPERRKPGHNGGKVRIGRTVSVRAGSYEYRTAARLGRRLGSLRFCRVQATADSTAPCGNLTIRRSISTRRPAVRECSGASTWSTHIPAFENPQGGQMNRTSRRGSGTEPARWARFHLAGSLSGFHCRSQFLAHLVPAVRVRLPRRPRRSRGSGNHGSGPLGFLRRGA